MAKTFTVKAHMVKEYTKTLKANQIKKANKALDVIFIGSKITEGNAIEAKRLLGRVSMKKYGTLGKTVKK